MGLVRQGTGSDGRPNLPPVFRTDDFRKSAWAGVAWLDDGVGAVLRKLDDLGLAEKTLVILASDNARTGKMTCNRGLASCLVRWTGKIPSGARCDQLTSNIDIVPTILDASRVQPPTGTRIDGRSWLPARNTRTC
ncbi:MAG: sulfatase-like hydrolase/transferase [Verrucomicrobia bacterium]|nr:sulfatase-like hydrolase/transferase [Verrucomicrobiota bacterium]